MLRTLSAFALTLVMLMGAAPRAEAEMITARDVDKILAIAQTFGSAEMMSNPGERPQIRGRMEGVTYLILFYGCRNDGSDCTDIQFGAIWEAGSPGNRAADIARANQWNTEKRFGNAYVDTDGVVIIKMEANIEYGVERRTLEDTFDWWRIAMREFPPFMFN